MKQAVNMIKVSTYQEDIIIINVCVPNNNTPKYNKAKT